MKQHFRLMAQYNKWMNGKIYATCEALGEAGVKRDQGAFFGSIFGTLNHLLWGDLAWMSRFTGSPWPAAPLGHPLYENFSDLQTAHLFLTEEIVGWVETLDEDWLAHGAFSFTSAVDGKLRSGPAFVYVGHLFNHQTHHRGQVTTLLSQNGIDPGVTDLPYLPAISEGAFNA